MKTLSFKIKLYTIDNVLIAHVPKDISKQLPSRGMVMGTGTLNGAQFTAPLEPDGSWSHWFGIDEALKTDTNVKDGDIVAVSLQSTNDWPRPQTPPDLVKALNTAPKAQQLWGNITPKAEWEWIRWIRSTKQADTRARRVEVAISKLNSGMRRPCCFNSNMCTDPSVSKNGVLLEPAYAK